MEIVAYMAISYLVVRVVIALINLLTRQYLRTGVYHGKKNVSILIPARNEEKSIGFLLDDLQQIKYEQLEILVLDDDSTDTTAEIVLDGHKKDQRIKYIKGGGLLPGWLGKNYACHQLARHARGEYLLFLDADVRVYPGVLEDSLAYMEKHDLALLSLFPVQVMKGWGEWMTVPVMNRILVGNLPMILIRKSTLKDFAAANGQFMLFNAEVYKNHWFHKYISDEKVEDIRIIRIMKKMKYPVHTLLSSGQVRCRMYRGLNEAMNGFAKNIHAFFGSNWFVLWLYVLLTTLGPVAVWFAFSLCVFVAYLAALVFFSFLVSFQSRQSVIRNLLWMPIQHFALIIITFSASYRHATGRLSWKGRKV
jgi:glycosyltransferase involved in cell wall biosynthesis